MHLSVPDTAVFHFRSAEYMLPFFKFRRTNIEVKEMLLGIDILLLKFAICSYQSRPIVTNQRKIHPSPMQVHHSVYKLNCSTRMTDSSRKSYSGAKFFNK